MSSDVIVGAIICGMLALFVICITVANIVSYQHGPAVATQCIAAGMEFDGRSWDCTFPKSASVKDLR